MGIDSAISKNKKTQKSQHKRESQGQLKGPH
jgi:hypothetical protein